MQPISAGLTIWAEKGTFIYSTVNEYSLHLDSCTRLKSIKSARNHIYIKQSCDEITVFMDGCIPTIHSVK